MTEHTLAPLFGPPPGQEDWRERAACAGVSPWLFDADDYRDERYERAAAICFGCPVMAECAESARRQRRWGVNAGFVFRDGQIVRRAA